MKVADGTFSLRMHRSLKQSLLTRLETNAPSAGNLAKVFTQVLFLLKEASPVYSKSSSLLTAGDVVIYKQLLPHVTELLAVRQSLANALELSPEISMELAWVLLGLGHYMYESHSMDGGLAVLEQARVLSDLPVAKPGDGNRKLQILWLVASLKLNKGICDRREGIQLMNDILQRRLQQFEALPVEKRKRVAAGQLATAYNNLACARMHDFEFEQAEGLLDKDIELRSEWGDETCFPSGFGEHKKNKALVLAARGDLPGALQLLDESLRLLSNVKDLGPKGRHILLTRFLRACVMFEAGQLPDALAEHVEVLSLRREALGAHHEHTVSSMYWVAKSSFALGELDIAR